MRYLRRVVNAFKYFLVALWHDYVWDYGGAYRLLYLKLHTLHEVMKNDPHHEYDAEIRAIRICVKILRRLNNDWYDRGYDRHDRRWGKSEYWTTPCAGDDHYSRFHSQRPGAVYELDKKQERKEFHNLWNTMEAIRMRDSRNLHNIMNKYMESWWS